MLRRIYSFIIILILCQLTFTSFAEQLSDTKLQGTKDFNNCLVCHVDPKIATILTTPHAQIGDVGTPFAQHGCDSCHGHQDHPKITFGPNSSTSIDEQNQICLACHEDTKRLHWSGSTHQTADLACSSCHTLHATQDPILAREFQNQACYFCHTQQKAQSFQRSRHPLREAIMICSDCHNAHGSANDSLLITNTINETCYSCHAEKRGPFLWEHPPVQENCALCHTPHGSTQDRLLKVRGPFLCQQCHAETFHPGVLYDGEGIPPMGAQNRLLAENCLNCHYLIHGSNHPAGVAFDR